MTVPIDIQDEDHFEELLGEAFLRKNLYRVRWSPNSDSFLNDFHAVDAKVYRFFVNFNAKFFTTMLE